MTTEICKWCLNPESHPRHDFENPDNHASAKHPFEARVTPVIRIVEDEIVDFDQDFGL
jgi:hypothetical protein